jgi:hypothetical protein
MYSVEFVWTSIAPISTFHYSEFCPHSVRLCFVRISEQTAIISLCSINWLLFYNRDGECLLRGTIWIFKYKSGWSYCSAVSSPTKRLGQSMWDLWRTKWHCDRFFSEYFGFPHSSFRQSTILIIFVLLLPDGLNGGSLEPSKELYPLENREAIYIKCFHCFSSLMY